MRKFAYLITAAAIVAATPAMAQESPGSHPDNATLEAEVTTLRAQLAAQAARLDQLEAQLRANTTAAAAAETPAAAAAAAGTITSATTATTASTAAAENAPAGPDTTIGGYGEISYNGYLKDRSRNQADLKRFVLFFGHRFNERLSFNSELEIEHAIASSSDEGEVEVEQAYLNYAVSPALNLKAGLFLMPFGFLNRNHEPPVFFGVERNEVETRIIPSTWREGGIGIYGRTGFGLSYDVGITTGFDVAKFDDAGAPLRGSHQELQLAKAGNLSFYGSLEYRGIPGLLVGGAVFSGNATHDNADFRADPSLPNFAGLTSRVTLWDVHSRWQHKGFDFQALYARGTINQAAQLDSVLLAYNATNGTDRPLVPSAFYGWLVQGAYSFALGGETTLDPFVRYEKFDAQARLPLGFISDPVNRDRILTAGFSFHPVQQVVIKADYQKFFINSANDRINLGLGYMF
ncbi:MAG: hypothetical protein JF593_11570 [Novosphingobium sp.]|nr:hypothetical protein [Novosphingobium sp.]